MSKYEPTLKKLYRENVATLEAGRNADDTNSWSFPYQEPNKFAAAE